jgi:hypothetical protein
VSGKNRALLIGYTTEKTFRHFASYALDAAPEVDILDLALLKDCRSLTISESPDDLIVEINDTSFQFSRYAAFFSRSYWADLGSQPRNQTVDRLTRAIAAWLVLCPATVINRPGSGMSNANKFAHGMLLKQMGFLTPPTLVTGAGEILRDSAGSGIELVSKSCSSAKTRIVALDDALLERAGTLGNCPGLFQHRVYGADVRVHSVDGLLLAERIESARVDYRFADHPADSARHIICDVPDDIARLCREYCMTQSLRLAGFDFKVTLDKEEWVILEVNPMPGFESYDRRQYNRISRAVLDLLLSGEPTPLTATDVFCNGARPASHNRNRGVSDARNGHERDREPDRNISGINDMDSLFVSEDRRPQIRPFYSNALRPGTPSR